MTPGALCRTLRARIPNPGAPADLGALVRQAGVSRVTVAQLPIDGILRREQDGRWTAVVSGEVPQTRQRYTLAHEAGHLALGTDSRSCFGGANRTLSERDADAFAAEALMPTDQFLAAVSQFPPKGDCLVSVAAMFEVSVEAAGLRICELAAWPVVIIRWRHMTRPGSGAKLRADWSAAHPSLRIYVPRFVPAPAEIANLADSGRGTHSDVVKLRLGSLRGHYLVETFVRGSVVLSLVVLNQK